MNKIIECSLSSSFWIGLVGFLVWAFLPFESLGRLMESGFTFQISFSMEFGIFFPFYFFVAGFLRKLMIRQEEKIMFYPIFYLIGALIVFFSGLGDLKRSISETLLLAAPIVLIPVGAYLAVCLKEKMIQSD